jgi:quercetin dioxygenase-like cupin family protein
VAALVLGLLPACHAARPPDVSAALKHGAIRRTLINRQPIAGLPGWETRLLLIEYGPGAVAPLHVHPADGIGIVINGSFESAFGDEAPIVVHTGEGFIDPAGVPHRLFRNLSEDSELRFLIAYTIRIGEETFYPGARLPESSH